jgi:hypothetical protein
MRFHAIAARYAHQQLPAMLGRAPKRIEWLIFLRCVGELRESEPTLLGGKTAEDANTP